MYQKAKKFLKEIISENQYHNLVNFYMFFQALLFFLRTRLSNVSLGDTGRHFHTDKVNKYHTFDGLSYLDIYETYFYKFKKKKIFILEIGVKSGASLRTWKSYFRKGVAFGIDIDPSCKGLDESRIKIEIGSQDDVEFLSKCFGAEQLFDIIIDDGSHINRHILTSFEYLFNKRLKPGGIYAIEDLDTSYLALQSEYNVLEIWPGMKYNNPTRNYDNDRKELDEFFLSKIKDLDFIRGNIQFVHFWSKISIIKKTSNSLPLVR